ncbi:MAG TPA: hypothetical protein VF502_12650 [Stellaceae bacterium]
MSCSRQHPAQRAVARCRAVALPVFLGLALSACVTGRSVIDVQPLAGGRGEDKAFAKITEVRDLRKFEPAPREPSLPSLGNAAEIGDPQVTARAIARKRSDLGTAFGDVVLPEGITVAGLVRSAAQKALQDAGYAVVDETSPYYAKALPLALDIDQFWAWSERGGYTIPLEFDSLVTMRGDALVGRDAPPVRGEATGGSAIVLPSSWHDLVERGLADLSDRMKERIKPAAMAAGDAAPATAAAEPDRALAPAEARPADTAPAQAAPTPRPAEAAPSPMPPLPAPTPRVGGLADQLKGRWISYQDAAFTGAPAPARQQTLLNRCAKSYALFEVKASRLVEEFHQGSNAWRNDYAIALQRPYAMAVRSVGAPGRPFAADVFLGREDRLAELSFPEPVLVFDIRAPQQGGSRYPARKYARCPAPP